MRIPLPTDIKTRTGAPDKDARLKNSYVETKGEEAIVRKRPSAQGGIAVGAGVAQGGIGLNIGGVPSFIGFWGDTINPGSSGGGVPYTGAGADWTNGATYPAGGSGPDVQAYTAFNPADKGVNFALSNADLTATIGSYTPSVNEICRSIVSKSSGKWYWEITIVNAGDPLHNVWRIGLSNASVTEIGQIGTWSSNLSFSNSDIIGVALNADTRTVQVYINGVLQTTPSISGTFTGAFYAAVGSDFDGTFVTPNLVCTANFGATPFAYTVPSGYNSGLYV